MRKENRFALIFFFVIVFTYTCNLNEIFQKSKDVFASNILESGKKLYSQNNEELIIRDFFNDRRGGVFVDIGCAHYKNFSTTYYLENHLEWSGLAVDALAEFAIGHIKNRPNTRFFNFIVTDHSGSIEPFYRLIDATGLSSTNKDYVQRLARYYQANPKYQVIYLPTITLNELLERNGISEIDFLSIDIEGGEPKALAGFDIQRFKPELVCIEKGEITKTAISEYFSRNGYERTDKYLMYDSVNWYFRPKR